MFNYIWPIGLAVLSNVVYQICAKSVPSEMNPFASLTITYAVAAIFSGVMTEIIGETGVDIETAADGLIAANMFEEHPEGYYDLILMDIQMPRMNGYEAAKAIRAADRKDAGTMTADAFEESVKASREAGMNDYITKPFEPRELLSVLRNNR